MHGDETVLNINLIDQIKIIDNISYARKPARKHYEFTWNCLLRRLFFFHLLTMVRRVKAAIEDHRTVNIDDVSQIK